MFGRKRATKSFTNKGSHHMIPDKGCRVAIYARSANEYQANLASHVSTQIAELSALCEQQEWKVVGCYVDRATSGLSTERKGLHGLLRDAEIRPQPFDIVLVRGQSRIARSIPAWLAIVEALEACGLRVRTPDLLADAREDEPGSLTIADRILATIVRLTKWRR